MTTFTPFLFIVSIDRFIVSLYSRNIKTKKELTKSMSSFICRRPESNRYGRLVPQDFKSCASASSATPAGIWAEVDSNHRSMMQQIYSLSPLATRESAHVLTRSNYSIPINHTQDTSIKNNFFSCAFHIYIFSHCADSIKGS